MGTCISVESLYSKYGKTLSYCSIIEDIGDEAYYDLFFGGELACMDGENCVVVKEGDKYILKNSNGEKDIEFILTEEEFKVATFTY